MIAGPENIPEEDEEEGLGLARLGEWAAYGARAVRRNPLTALAALVFAVGAAGLLVWALPDRYYVEARLLAQRPDVIAILGNPGRALAFDANASTQAVAETVLGRDNLVQLIRETGLREHWRATRPPVLRLKDFFTFGRSLNDDELMEVLVATLEVRLVAWAQEGLVSISVTWNDAEMAQRLVDTALKNFLETRHMSDMAILGESISLLEEHLAEARRGIEESLQGARAVPAPIRRSAASPTPLPPATMPDPASLELARLRGSILEKRRAVEDLVSLRDRRIADLQSQLAEQRAVYAESHPAIQNLKRMIAALAQDAPQLTAVRRELEEREAGYAARGGDVADLERSGAAPGAVPSSAPTIIATLQEPRRDPGEEYARSRLTAAITRYYSIVDRLEGARIERDAARAGVKYRYLVVRPPLRPREATNRGLKQGLWTAGAFLGLVLGLAAAVARELLRGRIVQRWQVERGLGLPILAELPALALSDRRDVSA